MSKFKVHYEVLYQGVYEIEAENESEAETQAYSMMEDGVGLLNAELQTREIYAVDPIE